MYEELIEMLRRKSRLEKALERWDTAEAFDGATDAIEELTEKNKRLYDDLGSAKAAIEDAYVAGRTSTLKVLSSLDDHQHYSGTYIKSLFK